MKRVLLVCALYCLATVAANSTVIWNVTLPNPTASPANGEDAPTPHAVISKALGLYAYVDTQYNVNVVNLTDGTHLWAHTVAGNLGLQFVEAYNQLVFNSLTFNTLQGRDAVTGAVLWSQASNFTANLPAFLYKGRFLTAQLQTGQNTSDMYQVDLATGKTVWQLPGPVNFNGECGQGITIFNSGNPAEFYAFGANLTTGNITWANTAVWGSWFGCLQNKAGAPVAIIKNEIANGHILAVVDPVSGHTIRNITVERYLHADQVFGSVGSIFCANTVRGQSEDYQPFVVCYDVDTGNVTMSLNINDEPVQDAYVLDGHVVLLKRNTSNGASVVLTAYNPTTAALVWNITTSTPGPIDVYYVPGNALIGSYVVVNHDDGFTALSHRKGSFNVTGLGTTVRVDSIRTTDDFATNAIVTTRYNGIRLKL